jgi:FkbM family methyltransferase
MAGDPNWRIEEMALDSKDGTAIFNVMQRDQFSSLHFPDHSLTNTFADMNKVSSRVEVRTSTLAKEFERHRSSLRFKRPFLKMDTQGHDLEVAKGAGNMLKEFVGLQSELGLRPLYENAPYYHDVLKFYESQGFALTAFVPNNEGHFPDLFETDCIMYNSAKWSGD